MDIILLVNNTILSICYNLAIPHLTLKLRHVQSYTRVFVCIKCLSLAHNCAVFSIDYLLLDLNVCESSQSCADGRFTPLVVQCTLPTASAAQDVHCETNPFEREAGRFRVTSDTSCRKSDVVGAANSPLANSTIHHCKIEMASGLGRASIARYISDTQ